MSWDTKHSSEGSMLSPTSPLRSDSLSSLLICHLNTSLWDICFFLSVQLESHDTSAAPSQTSPPPVCQFSEWHAPAGRGMDLKHTPHVSHLRFATLKGTSLPVELSPEQEPPRDRMLVPNDLSSPAAPHVQTSARGSNSCILCRPHDGAPGKLPLSLHHIQMWLALWSPPSPSRWSWCLGSPAFRHPSALCSAQPFPLDMVASSSHVLSPLAELSSSPGSVQSLLGTPCFPGDTLHCGTHLCALVLRSLDVISTWT